MPPSPWVRPRIARWNAWLCALAKPGQHDPRQPAAPRPAPGRPTTERNRPSCDVEQHVGGRAVRQQRVRGEEPHPARFSGQLGQHAWSARRPRPGSRPVRRTRPANARRRWGCGRRASRWAARRWPGCRRRGRPRCPAPARRPARPPPGPPGSGRRWWSGVNDSSIAPPPTRADLLGHRPDRGLVGSAGIEPGGDGRRDGVHAVRLDPHLADRRDAIRVGRGLPGGADHLGQRQHRVVPVGQPGGAGVVGFSGELEPPPPVRPDRGADRDRSVEVDQAAALLDVQFDEAADPAQRLGSSRPSAPDRARPRCIASARLMPSASRRPRPGRPSSAPVMIREPAQATPKRAPSSSPKLTTPIGRPGRNPAPARHRRRRRPTPLPAGRRRRRRRAPSPGAIR